MKLDRVTFTGADDSISPEVLVELSAAYPWIEWGILLLRSHGQWAKGNRFPSIQWIDALLKIAPADMKLTAHLCGGWVDSLMDMGTYTFAMRDIADRFQRVQLNFHAMPQSPTSTRYLKAVGRKFIFQVDSVNDKLIEHWVEAGYGFPLFDISGGIGLTPEQMGYSWPKPIKGVYCGYAGGLGPHNTRKQVDGPIREAVDSVDSTAVIWIDMETKVRSDHDKLFDINLVKEVVDQVKDLVTADVAVAV